MVWVFIFLFLADGLRRITKVMKGLTDCAVVQSTFILYVVTAALAIIGQIICFIAVISGYYRYSGAIIAENVIIFIFQIFLLVILNQLT